MTSESSAGVQDEVHAGRSGVEEVLIGPLQGVHRSWSGSFEKLSVQIRHEDQCAQTGVDRSRCPQVSSKSFSNTMTTTLLGLMSRRFREICCFIPGSPPCSSADARARGSEGTRRSGQLLRIVPVGLMLGRSNPRNRLGSGKE